MKTGDGFVVCPDGPELIVVSGGGHVCVTADVELALAPLQPVAVRVVVWLAQVGEFFTTCELNATANELNGSCGMLASVIWACPETSAIAPLATRFPLELRSTTAYVSGESWVA